MKVSEAKTKLCPFMSYQSSESSGESFMSNKTTPVVINCICDDCMAWEYTKFRKGGYHNDSADKFVETGAELPEAEKEGYCKRLGQ